LNRAKHSVVYASVTCCTIAEGERIVRVGRVSNGITNAFRERKCHIRRKVLRNSILRDGDGKHRGQRVIVSSVFPGRKHPVGFVYNTYFWSGQKQYFPGVSSLFVNRLSWFRLFWLTTPRISANFFLFILHDFGSRQKPFFFF